MRVPDLAFFRFFELENVKTREKIAKQFEKLASGKRFLNPSEDPYSAYRILELNNDIAKISQFSRNRLFSDNALSYADTILSGMEDKLRQLYARTIRGANQILKPDDLKALSEEFTQALKILVRQANEKFGENYLFSGDRITTKPFDETTYDYNGSANNYEVVLEESLKVPTFLTGSEIFGINVNLSVYEVEIAGFDDNPNNDDVSFTINSTTIAGDNLDELLRKIQDTFGEGIKFYTYTNDAGRTVIRLVSESSLTVSAGSGTSVSNIDLTGIDNVFKAVNYIKDKLSQGISLGYEDVYLMEQSLNAVISARAKVGSILSEVKDIKNYYEEKNLSLEKQKSDLSDIDMAKGISDYEKVRLTYDALMKLFTSNRELTILKYL